MPRVKFTSRTLIRVGDEDLMFDPGKILLSETVAVERATDLPWPAVVQGVGRGLMIAVGAAVWVLRKRSNPRLKPQEVEFTFDDLSLLDPDIMPEYWITVGDDDPDGFDVPDPDAPEEVAADNDEDADGPKEASPEPSAQTPVE